MHWIWLSVGLQTARINQMDSQVHKLDRYSGWEKLWETIGSYLEELREVFIQGDYFHATAASYCKNIPPLIFYPAILLDHAKHCDTI